MASDELRPKMQNPEEDPEDGHWRRADDADHNAPICNRFAAKRAKNSIQA
jgi:hypothetical protein